MGWVYFEVNRDLKEGAAIDQELEGEKDASREPEGDAHAKPKGEGDGAEGLDDSRKEVGGLGITAAIPGPLLVNAYPLWNLQANETKGARQRR